MSNEIWDFGFPKTAQDEIVDVLALREEIRNKIGHYPDTISYPVYEFYMRRGDSHYFRAPGRKIVLNVAPVMISLPLRYGDKITLTVSPEGTIEVVKL